MDTTPITAGDVQAWIDHHGHTVDFYVPKKETPQPESEATWLKEVHAGNLLAELFRDLSGTRVEYWKPVHGLALTLWLCDHKPSQLDEVLNLLKLVLSAGN